MSNNSAHSLSSLHDADYTHTGLSSSRANDLLQEYGPNKLPETPPPSSLKIILSQLKSPLVYVLIFAGLVTLALQHFEDTIIIAFAILLNTILGYIQEKRAGDALNALKKMLLPTAVVIRDSERQTIDAKDIVPGELVILNAGDKVPADGNLLEANRLLISESILTGESVPITKQKYQEAFMGTTVLSGQGLLEVKKTGEETEMGKIAVEVDKGDQEATPLQKQLSGFSKQLSFVVISVVLIVFLVGVLRGQDFVEIFVTSVALAVSAIPEGMLVALTVVLAIGMQRILKHKGLVRNLTSAETLGGVTVICSDKTGTLTLGEMSVNDVLLSGSMSSNASNIEIAQKALATQILVANDLDEPMLYAAKSWAEKTLSASKDDYDQKYPKIDSIPFDSENMLYLSLNSHGDSSKTLFVNGAPEVLLEKCNISSDEKEFFKQKISEYSKSGRRLIGYAQKGVESDVLALSVENATELTWMGLLAFSDPVRPDVKESLKIAQEAGIKIYVITGDYAQTAKAVMEELGINVSDASVMTGSQMEELSPQEFSQFVAKEENIKLFARTKPTQKLQIVQELKKNGEIVAMMGDGVNDAPALAQSDIGIVVNEASEVAKESSDLVLIDSSFTTITEAVAEGRGIFDNIRKITLNLLSDAFEGTFAILLTILFGYPLPLLASQILWINIISDGFPNLALAFEQKSHNIMKRPPRNPKEPLVTNWMKRLFLIVSLTGGITAFAIFVWVYTSTQDVVLARSIVFAAVGINSGIYAFSIRTLERPFWEVNLFSNKWLVIAVFASSALQVLPYMFQATRDFFNIVPIGYYWFVVIGAAFLMFFVIEMFKWVLRLKESK